MKKNIDFEKLFNRTFYGIALFILGFCIFEILNNLPGQIVCLGISGLIFLRWVIILLYYSWKNKEGENMKKKIYLANGLFSEADFLYNEILYKELTDAGFEVYAPQKNESINDKTKCADSIAIYHGDTDKLKWCDILVAVIDGPVVDPGVASEIGWIAGYNSARKYEDVLASNYGESTSTNKLIIGLFTDSREASKTYLEAKNELMHESPAECQYPYVNLYTVGAIKEYGKLFTSREEMLNYLRGVK